ncbi:S66 peptidase family protein [Luteococcus peritonei]|uniref:S66 peptidase family protein n=1 Tax=Luteococcus peritonei TaxID=88874 RepID=A0ABW4RRI9_9ACTN
MPESRPTILPRRLRTGDQVRVIAPAASRAYVMGHDNTRWVDEHFAALGLQVSLGEHVDELDVFASSSIESRLADLHAAFADPEVACVMTAIGGFNSNELLPHLDWELIAANPKVLCGYSDITALQNAIWAHTGLVTYSGPHWSSFGMRDHFEQTLEWFRQAVFTSELIELQPSQAWSDDAWFADQDDRHLEPNPGWRVVQPGEAAGTIVGGNLCTLNLLQGTTHMPSLDGALLFLEDDAIVEGGEFARNLTSLLQLPDAHLVTGLVLGRFQRDSEVLASQLDEMVRRQPALAGKPVLAEVDLGHTYPMITFPVGGRAELCCPADGSPARLVLTQH